jgi:hypothetical protein
MEGAARRDAVGQVAIGGLESSGTATVRRFGEHEQARRSAVVERDDEAVDRLADVAVVADERVVRGGGGPVRVEPVDRGPVPSVRVRVP